MSLIRWVFLESLPALGVVLFVSNFWLLVWWRRGGSARPLLASLGISGVLLIVQVVVTTQREHAARVLGAIEQGVPRADVSGLDAALASSFAAGPMSRAEFVNLARSRLQDIKVNTVRRLSLEIAESGVSRFVALAAYQCDIVHPDFGSGWVATGWRFTFVREGEAWRIAEIDLPTVNGVKLGSWREK
ncbi:MAG: hypothetical protein JNG88_00430 [Phycisphaerales bacterium]|nr:hypothetical protein [Phycisphaerales bacterium]